MNFLHSNIFSWVFKNINKVPIIFSSFLLVPLVFNNVLLADDAMFVDDNMENNNENIFHFLGNFQDFV